MKIKKTDFSFEESLKYLDDLVAQKTAATEVTVARQMNEDELPANRVVTAYCLAMVVKVFKKYSHPGELMDYVFFGALSQMMNLLQSVGTLRHLDLQTDGSLMALFDTPKKTQVEEIIDLSAQIRSINGVVLKKFGLGDDEQAVSVGIDYGPVSYFMTGKSPIDPLCYGSAIRKALILANVREDSVNISENIHLNLSEETQTKLFSNRDAIHITEPVATDIEYYYSPLINLRMQKWLVER